MKPSAVVHSVFHPNKDFGLKNCCCSRFLGHTTAATLRLKMDFHTMSHDMFTSTSCTESRKTVITVASVAELSEGMSAHRVEASNR